MSAHALKLSALPQVADYFKNVFSPVDADQWDGCPYLRHLVILFFSGNCINAPVPTGNAAHPLGICLKCLKEGLNNSKLGVLLA